MIELQTSMKLVLEVVAVDGLSTSSSACGVTTLDHEVFDDSMEDSVGIVALHAQLHKVPHRLQK